MRPALLQQQLLLARIAESEVQLSVHYAPARPPAAGSSPSATRPANPLTGTIAPPKAIQPALEPAKPAVTMNCLWLDTASVGELTRGATHQDEKGWLRGADALARVAISDAAVDPDQPNGATVFDDCEHVERDGRRFRVLKVEPVGPSFAAPCTYSVWLTGAVKQ